MKNSILRDVRYLSTSPYRLLLPFGIIYHFAKQNHQSRRAFHSSPRRPVIKPYILADIGEGITECQIMSWYVQPGDGVKQFDKICEVQSDKASVEITSRFDGVVTALHYATDDMAIVGKPLIDIDVEEDISEVPDLQTESADTESNRESVHKAIENVGDDIQLASGPQQPQMLEDCNKMLQDSTMPIPLRHRSSQKHTSLLTPGVRHMLEKLNLDVENIQGSGRDGRVLKEDIQRYMSKTSANLTTAASKQGGEEDRIHTLSPIEMHMVKVMTSSLSIPHFLYTHTIDVTVLNGLRKKYNSSKTAASNLPAKLTTLPFILKAVSQSFMEHPRLNSHLDTETDPKAPRLLIKGSHNFGIAVDTSHGLLVPVIRNVQNHSIASLGSEISRLSKLAQDGRLAVDDFKGATFIISNIGSIGGGVVSPIIVAPTMGILGIGRTQHVPVFNEDDHIVKQEQLTLSWSADHRFLDGAAVAKCAERVGDLLSNIDIFGIYLR